MERIAVFLNDADHAREVISPMQSSAPTHWMLVGCPPSLPRHAARWVSKAAHEAWIERWSSELFAQLTPALGQVAGSRVETMLVKRGARNMAGRLVALYGPIRLLDARRPRWGQMDEPLSPEPSVEHPLRRWAAPVTATAGLSSLLLLAD
jgi:hypothetical protein